MTTRRPSSHDARLIPGTTLKQFPWVTINPAPAPAQWIVRGSRGSCALASPAGPKHCFEAISVKADVNGRFIDVDHSIKGTEALEWCPLTEFASLNERISDYKSLFRQVHWDTGESQDKGFYVILEQSGSTEILSDPYSPHRLPIVRRNSRIKVRIPRPRNIAGAAWLKQYGVEAGRTAYLEADGYIPRMNDVNNLTFLLCEPFGRKGTIE